jgi:transcriptional regulator with GAF, ATPase, and Fis domain
MGESGTGKELVARLIHTLDMRSRKRELVTVDCTAIMPELSGSESSATNVAHTPGP